MSPMDARLARLLAPIDAGMTRVRERIAGELASESPAVADMTAHISRFRGKQLRAALVLLSGAATGNDDGELPEVAAIVELIHLATLVHDDVLDGADVRRRVASVNRRWDNQVAVLLGDLLYARAFHLSTTLSSPLCSRLLSTTTQRICVGEIDQAASRYDFDLTDERYEAIAGAKTAALYSAACELGARYPGGGEREALGAEMARFGWEIGLAFQIADDVLDVTGSEADVGKSVGNDVEDGKVTLPVLLVHRNADEAVRAAIRDAYTRPGLERRVEHLRAACDLQPGVDAALARARALVDTALGRLAALPPTPAREALAALGEYVQNRSW